MDIKHYAVIGAFFLGLSSIVGSLPNWAAATSPLFVSGVIGILGSTILAVYSNKPGDTK